MEEKMNQVSTIILVAIMAVMGGGATLYLVVSLPALIIWKIYRMFRYGYKITD